MSKPKAIDLFCGTGGASLGLVKAGFEVVGAVDAFDPAIETYKHNLCERELEEYDGEVSFDSPLQADLSRGRSNEYSELPAVDYFEICDFFNLDPGEVDVICGCPPCQNYSYLRDTEPWNDDEPKDLLLQTYVEFIRESTPDIVIFENVPGILTAGGEEPTAYVDWFLRQMRDMRREGDNGKGSGYGKEFQVINAANFGVPQTRERAVGLFVYGADDNDVQLPEPSHKENPGPESDYEEWNTVENEILGKDFLKVDLDLGQRQVDIEGYPNDPAHRARQHRSRTVNRAKYIRKFGDSWRDLLGTDYEYLIEECHEDLKTGAHSAYGIMAGDKPAQTLTTKCTNISSGRFTHPRENRSITLREAALLMTFPRWFEFPCTHDHSETVIGNAVPPKLMTKIATSALSHFDDKNLEQPVSEGGRSIV
jgi:DNA (cytosine-5)-methyltransferase 1